MAPPRRIGCEILIHGFGRDILDGDKRCQVKVIGRIHCETCCWTCWTGHIRWQDGPSVTRVLLLLSLKQKVSSWCLRFRHRLIEVASPPSNVAPRCCSTIIFILKPTLKPKFILELNCHPYSTAVHTKVLHKEYSRWSSVGCSMYKSGENQKHDKYKGWARFAITVASQLRFTRFLLEEFEPKILPVCRKMTNMTNMKYGLGLRPQQLPPTPPGGANMRPASPLCLLCLSPTCTRQSSLTHTQMGRD